MPCLVHKVNRRVGAGLFIFEAFGPSAVFPPLAFGSLKSFRKEAGLAGMFFVPASLSAEEKGGRFIITAWGAGWGGGDGRWRERER